MHAGTKVFAGAGCVRARLHEDAKTRRKGRLKGRDVGRVGWTCGRGEGRLRGWCLGNGARKARLPVAARPDHEVVGPPGEGFAGDKRWVVPTLRRNGQRRVFLAVWIDTGE